MITLTMLGLAAGAEGALAVDDGLSGDDYTGLMALAAEFVLVAFGVRTVWQSRRAGGGRVRRYARRTLIGMVGLVLAYQTVMPVAVSYALTHAAVRTVPKADLGPVVEDVTMRTSDGLELSGCTCRRGTVRRSSSLLDVLARRPVPVC